MTTCADQRGVALLAVLGLVLALLPVVAAVCMQANLDGLMQRNHRGSAQAFYTAEAGLAHALAEIPPSLSLHLLLSGADGVEGTSDDGQFHFRTQPPTGLSYEVRVAADQADSIRLQSTGHGAHGAVRALELVVAPRDVPFTPAAVYIEAGGVDLDLGTRGFSLSGVGGGEEGNAAAAIGGLAVTSDTVATDLRAALQPERITGTGAAPSIVTSSPLDLDSYIMTLRRRLDAVILSTGPATDVVIGTATNPQLTVIDSEWQVTSQVEGFGILVARGDVEISGGLRYSGLVIVAGDLRLTDTGNAQVEGTLWVRHNGAARIDLQGTGGVRYDPGTLRRTATALAGSLFHLPQVLGWREGP